MPCKCLFPFSLRIAAGGCWEFLWNWFLKTSQQLPGNHWLLGKSVYSSAFLEWLPEVDDSQSEIGWKELLCCTKTSLWLLRSLAGCCGCLSSAWRMPTFTLKPISNLQPTYSTFTKALIMSVCRQGGNYRWLRQSAGNQSKYREVFAIASLIGLQACVNEALIISWSLVSWTDILFVIIPSAFMVSSQKLEGFFFMFTAH